MSTQRKQIMAHTPVISRLQLAVLLGLLLALAACSTVEVSQGSSSPTSTANTTPTPPPCGVRFSSAYQPTLPEATSSQTTVYAQVPMPPQTRYYSDDASGLRGRFMCSGGTKESVSAFMTQHLTQLGWQPVTPVTACGMAVIPGYRQPQCWKNGSYQLYVGINSNTDWVIAYIDPAFLT